MMQATREVLAGQRVPTYKWEETVITYSPTTADMDPFVEDLDAMVGLHESGWLTSSTFNEMSIRFVHEILEGKRVKDARYERRNGR